METLYTMQKELHGQIKNSFVNFKRKGAAQMSKITARTRLSGLEHWYAQFEANHTQILILSVSQREHEYFKSHLSDQIIDDYFDRKGEFEQYIEDAEQLENERNAAETPPPAIAPLRQIMAVDHQSLPEINLPKFTGLQSQWENLRDLFYSIVHRRTDLDVSIKYDYLRSSLTDEALDRMKSIHISAEHYETAWNCLLKHYDNPLHIVSNLTLELSSVQPMTPEADSELLQIYTKISGSLENLKASNRTIEDLGSDLIAHSLVQQYPDSVSLPVDDAHHWTDSADVLFWLKDHPFQWNFSVSNRCSDIPTSVPHAFWHHVKSQHSPTDVLSRKTAPSSLKDHAIWWKGPRFLTEDPCRWTREQDELNFSVISVVSASRFKIAAANADSYSPHDWDLIARYATLESRLRVTALRLRFLCKASQKIFDGSQRKFRLLDTGYPFLDVVSTLGIISASEMESALAFWRQLTQMALFKAEYATRSSNKRPNSSNAMAIYDPLIQGHLIRVGGRLTHQLSDEDAKHPVNLSHSSAPTTLLIKYAHLQTLPGGIQLSPRVCICEHTRKSEESPDYAWYALVTLPQLPLSSWVITHPPLKDRREIGFPIPKRSKCLFRRRPPRIGELMVLTQQFTPPGKRPTGKSIPPHPDEKGSLVSLCSARVPIQWSDPLSS